MKQFLLYIKSGLEKMGSKIIIGINDLATTNPELVAEWHPTKNNISPYDISKGSTKKVWWLGKCGHEWQASPNDRTHSTHRLTGCPYCAGNKILKGFNDLATTNSQLAAEWHPNKNGNLEPSKVSAGSTKRVWWLGKCGHEWQAVINSRNKGRGCPYCSNSLLLAGVNDLATINPQLAAEWHPTKNGNLKPHDIISGSHKKIWWLCKNGHEWQATCNSRNDSGRGCPICSKQSGAERKVNKLIEQEGSLSINNPELAAEWHPTKNGNLKPENVMAGSDKKVWWLGKCGHEWQAIIKDRNKGSDCPYCTNKQLLPGYNDLKTVCPELAREWHPTKNGELMPDNIVSGSSIKVWWKCSQCGNEWQATVISRKTGMGCPKCSQERNTSYPEQAIYYYLQQVFPEAVNRYTSLGREIDIYIPSIKVGVEYDGARYHTEETRNKELSKDAFFKEKGIKIYRIKENKSDNGLSIKDNIITYKATSTYSTLDEVICALLKIFDDEYGIKTDILVNNKKDMTQIMACYLSSIKKDSFLKAKPELLTEWNYEKNADINPEYINANSNKKVWWKCKQGHEWQAVVYTRVNGSKCPYCTNKKVLAGFNDLATKNPILATEWNYEKNEDLLPKDVQPGTNKKVWWKCKKCNYEWSALISNRNNGAGCPRCARLRNNKSNYQ